MIRRQFFCPECYGKLSRCFSILQVSRHLPVFTTQNYGMVQGEYHRKRLFRVFLWFFEQIKVPIGKYVVYWPKTCICITWVADKSCCTGSQYIVGLHPKVVCLKPKISVPSLSTPSKWAENWVSMSENGNSCDYELRIVKLVTRKFSGQENYTGWYYEQKWLLCTFSMVFSCNFTWLDGKFQRNCLVVH